jgi:hypothetical protein
VIILAAAIFALTGGLLMLASVPHERPDMFAAGLTVVVLSLIIVAAHSIYSLWRKP